MKLLRRKREGRYRSGTLYILGINEIEDNGMSWSRGGRELETSY